MWKPLQSNQSTHGTAADEDDGSGMGWVKRRREQREREKAEQEAKEKAAAEVASTSDDAPRSDDAQGTDVGPPNAEEIAPASAEQPAQEQTKEADMPDPPAAADIVASPESEAVGTPMKEAESEHATLCLQMPAPPHHAIHRRTLSGRLASGGEPTPEGEKAAFASPAAVEAEQKMVENEEETGSSGSSSDDEDDGESSTREFDDAEDDEVRRCFWILMEAWTLI
jgi:hypothetical protein